MVHTYKVSGMTCSGCETKLRSALLLVDGIISVDVSAVTGEATISMDKHVSLSDLQKAAGEKFRLSPIHHSEVKEQTKSWFKTYKPVLMIFFYITIATLAIQWRNGHFDPFHWMEHFMAGFFLVFSFFKLLDLKGFAESYVMYDIIARRLPLWAPLYAFIELGLGIAYLSEFNPLVTNIATIIVMGTSIIGVLQTVFAKKSIRCACLGAVFNLPMSTVTIIEDGLMIVMSVVMLALL